MENIKKTPKVSICVVTYNQEKFIRECLQSIVDQETYFDFEILVADDCSTDGTRSIIKEFKNKYPTLIKPIYRDKNIGAYKNYILTHQAATGEYIAHIDGDDLILPGKIQAQALLMEQNADISLSAHAVSVLNSKTTIGTDKKLPVFAALEDLLRLGTYFVHSSTMYRASNEVFQKLNDEVIDFQTYIEHASRGKIHLNKKILGVYRQHSVGISKLQEHRKKIENAYETAFDRALELGAAYKNVQRARLDRRMKIAIGRYLAGDLDAYKSLIKLSSDEDLYATVKHKILSKFLNYPMIIDFYFKLKRLVL